MPAPELLATLQAFSGQDWWSHARLLRELAAQLHAEGALGQAEEADWEARVCFLIPRLPDWRTITVRFAAPFAGPGDPSVLPEPLGDPRVVSHLLSKAQAEPNRYLRARYGDAAFSAGAKRCGLVTASAYLELEPQVPVDNWLVRYDALARALQVSLSVNSLPVAREAARRLVALAVASRDAGAHRWTMEACAALLLDRARRLPVDLREQARDVLVAMRDTAAADWHKYEAINGILIDVYRSLGQSEEAAAARRAAVDNLAAEGDRLSAASHVMAAHFYARARDALADLGGDDALLQRLTTRVEAETGAAVASGELKPMAFPIELPIESVRRVLEASPESARLAQIGALDVFPSDIDLVAAQAEDLQRLAPLALGIPRTLIRQGRPAYRSQSDDLSATVLRILNFNAMVYGATVCQVLHEAFEVAAVTAEGTLRFVMGGSLVPTSKEPFVRTAVDAFRKQDFLTFIHVLVPHLEDVFRHAYGLLGHPTSSMREGVADAVPLPTILSDPDISALFGAGTVAGFQTVLIERAGLNLRHDVAHGLLQAQQIDRASAGILMWMLLRLSISGRLG